MAEVPAEAALVARRRSVALRHSYRALRGVLRAADYLSTNADERASKTGREGVTFHVGQVLRHRKYGFRAAVFGWDERPHVDVSQWDGVVGLPSGAEQPFYRMVPDHSDCVSLLGGTRALAIGMVPQMSPKLSPK